MHFDFLLTSRVFIRHQSGQATNSSRRGVQENEWEEEKAQELVYREEEEDEEAEEKGLQNEERGP